MRPTIEASRRPPFNAGLALWERRDHVAAASDLLRRLIRLVGRPTDLTPYQWGQLFAAAVDFAPTVILELGRGLGNSTCVFTTAALAVDARVVSVCLSDSWRTVTRPRVAGVVPPSWLARLDARETDICGLDFDAILGESPRVLVFWDAHGYQIAEHVLGRLLPAMAGREQLVLMHDLSDVRFEGHRDLGYGGQGLWQATDFGGARVRLGHLDSAVEQAVAIMDFTSRNHLPLHSAAEDLHEVIGRHPSRVETLQTLLGDFFALQAHWFHFSPNERAGPLGFPAAPRIIAPDRRPSLAPPPVEVRLPAASSPLVDPTPAVHTGTAGPANAGPASTGPATAVRPGPRLVSRGRHRQSLDLVITGRSDDHGGPDFLERLCVAARHNHALLSAAGIPHTFTLVEWNPLPDRPLLSTAVTEALPFWGRCWVVDPAWHVALCENPRLRFMEFFAKNAAIRRSTADLVLTTNSDVFLSTALVDRLADGPLLDEHVYRAVRHDVDRAVDWRAGGEAALADPRNHVRVNTLSAPDYGNASGDFLLLTRATYSRLRGFNETVRYAKIHKDGQFCYRAFVEGLAFVSLGPIWHIDHEGSYANVGAQKGAPDMPYGPEWDWRQTYRNPGSWGLAAAVEEPRSGQAAHLHHPHTHGPVLSVVAAADRIPMADAVGKATGRFLLINAPPDLAPDDERALAGLCEEHQLERAVFAGLSAEDPLLGAIPAPEAPFLIARDLLDRSGGWPELATDPALTWWLASAGRPVRVLDWPSPRRPAVAAAGLRPTARLLAIEHGGDSIPAGLWHEAALECGELVPRTAALLAAWVASLGLRADAAIGICGPDWATPGLLTALEGAGLGVAGLYTQATGQEGSLRWGARLKALDRLVADAVTDLLTVGLEPAVLARLERAGFAGRTHQLLGASPAGLPPDLPSEMAHLRAALGAATARGEVAVATDVLTALATLAGAGRWDYTYDAALGWDRIGRHDEAQRLFESVVAGDGVEPTLRNRARFHAGRLACARGAHGVARAHLSALLAEVPDHGRAQEYLDTLPAAPAAADGTGDA